MTEEKTATRHLCAACRRIVKPTAKGNAPAHKSYLNRFGYCPGTGKPAKAWP